MLKKLGNLAYNPEELLYIYVDHGMSQVEVTFKGGYSKTIPFTDITPQLTLDMVLDSQALAEEQEAEKLSNRPL